MKGDVEEAFGLGKEHLLGRRLSLPGPCLSGVRFHRVQELRGGGSCTD